VLVEHALRLGPDVRDERPSLRALHGRLRVEPRPLLDDVRVERPVPGRFAVRHHVHDGVRVPRSAGRQLRHAVERRVRLRHQPQRPSGRPHATRWRLWNLGGAFGDTVPNGGYRCSVSATGNLGTGIDQCMNGAWVVGTCTCMVSFGSAMDPSQCFDIAAQGSAQCGYGATNCAQCAQGSGCQTM